MHSHLGIHFIVIKYYFLLLIPHTGIHVVDDRSVHTTKIFYRIYLREASNLHFIALIIPPNGQLLYRPARLVPPNDRKSSSVLYTSRISHAVYFHQVAHHTSFLSRQINVMSQYFLFGVCRHVFEELLKCEESCKF